MSRKAVVLLSGGLDSTTLAYDYAKKAYDLHLISFDYGQRHHYAELEAAKRIAGLLAFPHHVIGLSVVTPNGGHWPDHDPLATVLGSTSLVSDTPVPDGHYADETMRQTVVPNRNAMMLSVAYGIAVAEEADVVAFAAHAGDHAIYPDCRPGFVAAFAAAMILGNQWKSEKVPELSAPYLSRSKGAIAVLATQIDVPIEETWSCYKGGGIHCGTCGTCVERREALSYAANVTGRPDPTHYLDATTTYEVKA